MKRPSISVILCAFNPRPDLLERAVGAIGRQTLPGDQVEFIVVDNNSVPPLSAGALAQCSGAAVRLIREPKQGLLHARAAGIGAASTDLICFVDDDNILAEDYLAAALGIAASEPDLGAFGGRTAPELEKPVSAGFAAFLPYFGVNDHGVEPLTGAGDQLGPWTPIGAGLCVTRPVAEAFRSHVADAAEGATLGRAGAALMSGEDTLFSVFANRLGLKTGYRPGLTLRHVIAADRLNFAYLARLMEGHGRSRTILAEMMNVGEDADPPAASYLDLALNFIRRLKGHGFSRAFGMYFWDRGRRVQKRDA